MIWDDPELLERFYQDNKDPALEFEHRTATGEPILDPDGRINRDPRTGRPVKGQVIRGPFGRGTSYHRRVVHLCCWEHCRLEVCEVGMPLKPLERTQNQRHLLSDHHNIIRKGTSRLIDDRTGQDTESDEEHDRVMDLALAKRADPGPELRRFFA